ncbi:unnamed protein product, partial [Meganyctiphanes norvegica]
TREGWKVVTGRFSKNSSSDVLVVSVPQADNLRGKVIFYDRDFNSLLQLHGNDFAANYGFTLASGDFDGDDVDDLLVGAPLAPGALGIPEAGKLYVYYAPLQKESAASPSVAIITGNTPWARHASSIANLQDIDNDGFSDVAVGAPYGGADQNGEVYIYNGSPTGLQSTPSQIIQGSEISGSTLRGFGYSLHSGHGMDVDNNGHADLLVGAPESDKALLLRSSPVVRLVGSVRFQTSEFTVGRRDCDLDVPGRLEKEQVDCLQLIIDVQYKAHHLRKYLNMTFEMLLDEDQLVPRVLFQVN